MHGRVKIKTEQELLAERKNSELEQYKKLKEAFDLIFAKRKKKCFDMEAFKITSLMVPQVPDAHVLWNIRREIILYWKTNGHPFNGKSLSAEVGADQISNYPIKVEKKDDDKLECHPETVVTDSLYFKNDNDDISPTYNENEVNQLAESVKLQKFLGSLERPNNDQLPIKPSEEASEESSKKAPKELTYEEENERLMDELYRKELEFTAMCLAQQPKSYAVWHHRGFIITTMSSPDYMAELKACDKFLDMDERNFHCWDYRRFICELGSIKIEDELAFTEKKIKQNFSNFSSFYYRSYLLTKAHKLGLISLNDIWQKEHETVMAAIFTDPNDQSPWFYYKWLLAADQYISYKSPKPNDIIYRVIMDYRASRIIFQFHEYLFQNPFATLELYNSRSERTSINCSWTKLEPISSNLWFISVPSTDVKTINFKFQNKNYNIDFTNDLSNQLGISVVSNFKPGTNWNPESKLTNENLQLLQNIHEIEPENKWVILMLSSIRGQLDADKFDLLLKLDPLRKNYYLDQKSKCLIERNLQAAEESSKGVFIKLNLTSFHHFNRLTTLRFLDLSCNNLKTISCSFNSLVCLETLILDNNEIVSIPKGLKMPSLQKLSLIGNNINVVTLLNLKNCEELKLLDLTGTGICKQSSTILLIRQTNSVEIICN